MATPNRNSSPTYRWATPFTRLRKENSFRKFVKKNHNFSSSYIYRIVANKPDFLPNIIIYKCKYNTPKTL
ncbi:hypothetical protein BCAH1134_C0779 (plasmid) [Bacillus cereus AH1134]|nr:hypothetical protein BCAH1134_C0779 [Bacillus cereus AH1134]